MPKYLSLAPVRVLADEEAPVDEDHDSLMYALGRWWRQHSPPSKEVCSNITVPEGKQQEEQRGTEGMLQEVEAGECTAHVSV